LGAERYRRAISLNSYRYSAEEAFATTAEEREARRQAFERPLDAIQGQGLTYWEAVLLPEIDAGDRRLNAIEPDQLSTGQLADHLVETLAWYCRLWALHGVA